MVVLRIAVSLLWAVGNCLALPTFPPDPPGPKLPTPIPLVIWHGLGDSHSSAGMLQFQGLIKDVHKDIFIHSVYIDEEASADQKAGFFGNLFEQLEFVSEQLKSIPELEGGFDALGFSQGGQFLRAYTEMYNDPPVHNLITFGSQHFGVSDLPGCRPFDFFCKAARSAARAGVYSSWAQNNLIQAQYFRDPNRLETYLESNLFLTSINNEVSTARNQTFADNLSSLTNLVLIIFDKDKTVVPKESAWFGSYSPPPSEEDEEGSFRQAAAELTSDGDWELITMMRDDDEEGPQLIEMRDHPIYKEDWIGLKRLDDKGAIHLRTCDGEHMQINTQCWKHVVERFVGALKWEDDEEEEGARKKQQGGLVVQRV